MPAEAAKIPKISFPCKYLPLLRHLWQLCKKKSVNKKFYRLATKKWQPRCRKCWEKNVPYSFSHLDAQICSLRKNFFHHRREQNFNGKSSIFYTSLHKMDTSTCLNVGTCRSTCPRKVNFFLSCLVSVPDSRFLRGNFPIFSWNL